MCYQQNRIMVVMMMREAWRWMLVASRVSPLPAFGVGRIGWDEWSLGEVIIVRREVIMVMMMTMWLHVNMGSFGLLMWWTFTMVLILSKFNAPPQVIFTFFFFRNVYDSLLYLLQRFVLLTRCDVWSLCRKILFILCFTFFSVNIWLTWRVNQKEILL